MHETSQPKTTSVKKRVLETTLVAVRDRKIQRNKNRISIISSAAVILLVVAVVSLKNIPSPQDATATSANPPHPATTSPTLPSIIEVSMAMSGDVRTVDLSADDLARLVFNPSFKFIEAEDSYTWKSKSMLIYMDLPTTSLAITDSRY